MAKAYGLHRQRVSGALPTQAALQAEIDAMTKRFVERASNGSLCGRRGLYDHHARVLRQASARLAHLIAASAESKAATEAWTNEGGSIAPIIDPARTNRAQPAH